MECGLVIKGLGCFIMASPRFGIVYYTLPRPKTRRDNNGTALLLHLKYENLLFIDKITWLFVNHLIAYQLHMLHYTKNP